MNRDEIEPDEVRAQLWNRTSAVGARAHGIASLIDVAIGIIAALLLELLIFKGKLGGVFFVVYYLFKDIFFGGLSIGKRIKWCFVFEVKAERLCPPWKQPIRIILTYVLGVIEVVPRVFLKIIPGIFLRVPEYIQWGLSLHWGAHLMGLIYVNKEEFREIEAIKGKIAPTGAVYKYGWTGLVALVLILKIVS